MYNCKGSLAVIKAQKQLEETQGKRSKEKRKRSDDVVVWEEEEEG